MQSHSSGPPQITMGHNDGSSGLFEVNLSSQAFQFYWYILVLHLYVNVLYLKFGPS